MSNAASTGSGWSIGQCFLLVVLDHEGEQIESVGFGRAGLWFVLEISFDLRERRVVVRFEPKRSDYFFAMTQLSPEQIGRARYQCSVEISHASWPGLLYSRP